MANNHVALRYRQNDKAQTSQSSAWSQMVYIGSTGQKVATPNDKRVTAEIKNRSEAVRLEFNKKILEKDLMRTRFMIKMEQKQALTAFKVTMENSGKSAKGQAPFGPGDRAHETSEYFTRPGRLSMKRLVKWRAEEKQLQRMIKEDEASHPPPPDIERDAAYYQEFLQMINSLGLETEADEDGRHPNKLNKIISPDFPVSARPKPIREVKISAKTRRDGVDVSTTKQAVSRKATVNSTRTVEKPQIKVEAKKTQLRERTPTPRPNSAESVDVFECLKPDKDPYNITESPLELILKRRKPQLRVKSAPCRSSAFSIHQWEKDTIDNYVRIASRPASPFTGLVGQCQRHIRPSSAPSATRNGYSSTKGTSPVSDLETICERYVHNQKDCKPPSDSQTRSMVNPREPLFSKRQKKPNAGAGNTKKQPMIIFRSFNKDANSYKKLDESNSNQEFVNELPRAATEKDSHTENPASLKASDYSALYTRDLKLQLKTTLSESPIEKSENSEFSSDEVDSHLDCPDAVDNVSDISWIGKPARFDPNRDIASTGDRPISGLRQGRMMTSSPNPAENSSSGEEDDEHLVAQSHWRRDLIKEAPPGLFSENVRVKVRVAMSKQERQRQLETMVRAHTYELKKMVQRERIRKVRKRVKTLVTMRRLNEAAGVARSALSRPRTDSELLREVMV